MFKSSGYIKELLYMQYNYRKPNTLTAYAHKRTARTGRVSAKEKSLDLFDNFDICMTFAIG